MATFYSRSRKKLWLKGESSGHRLVVKEISTDCDQDALLIRVETRAGHGAGKPVWMQVDDFADQWAFLAQALGMPVPAS